MSRKIHVNRLSQDELKYELAIRGIAAGNCEEMRHRLVLAFQMEKSGDSVKYPQYPFTYDEDAAAVDKLIKEMIPAIGAFNENRKSNNYQRYKTKLSHALNRLDNMDPGNDDTKKDQKSQWVAMVLTLMNKLDDMARKAEAQSRVPPALNLVESGVTPGTSGATPASAVEVSSESSDDEDDQSFQANIAGAVNSTVHPTATGAVPRVRVEYPNRWNLQFSGEAKGLSLSAFLERCEELRVARHVPKEVLLESGVDLFTGKAYQFYLAYRNEVATWDELVNLLREEFQPCNYNEKLFEEIRRRTQGPGESIGIYLAVMAGYFKRLTCPISEEAKLKILLRNLAPFYQNQLGLVDVTSISQLRTVCRRLEERREAVDNYVQPVRRNAILEPDLAFLEEDPDLLTVRLKETKVTDAPTSTRNDKEIICFRCNKPGHRAIGCVLPRPKFCFRCKKEGVTSRTCPNCKRSGNAGGRP